MTPPSRTLVLVVMFLPATVGGCSSKDGLVPVRGTVTYRDKPLPSALVVFMPQTPGVLPSSGLTDSNGRYELMTIVQGDGASVGKHRVTITARKERPDALPGSNIEGEPLIPKKYFMPDTSGLTAEVTPGGITADFPLK